MKSPTNVERHLESPAPPREPGIVMVSPSRVDTRGAWIVRGAFHLTLAEATALGRPPHRAVTLLVQRDDDHNVFTPFREHILFADDEVAVGGRGVGGYFNIDVHAHMGQPIPGRYFFIASIGVHVSTAVGAVCAP